MTPYAKANPTGAPSHWRSQISSSIEANGFAAVSHVRGPFNKQPAYHTSNRDRSLFLL